MFHRFGNRNGLMYALMVQRAQALEEAVTAGPPPLGPGAPDRDRLLAFLDATARPGYGPGLVTWVRNRSCVTCTTRRRSPRP